MAKVTLYFPDRPDKPETHDATNVQVKGGVLSFMWRNQASDRTAKAVTTNIPFVVEDEKTGL